MIWKSNCAVFGVFLTLKLKIFRIKALIKILSSEGKTKKSEKNLNKIGCAFLAFNPRLFFWRLLRVFNACTTRGHA